MTDKKTIVRFAPSPTGPFHMGSVRTALYNYLFAKQTNGTFLLRIEDTDLKRSKKEYEEEVYESLRWLNLRWEDGVLRQSERTEVYREKLKELIAADKAYEAEEQNDGSGRKVIRIRNHGHKIKFRDLIRGEIEEDVSQLGDFVIARNIDEPVYHFVVVVDDLLCNITHVIRGEDHISNTARQILIIESLGGTRPEYAHLPLVLAPDKTKLSKRKHGEAASLALYRKLSYEPEAIINFMSLIGWNPGGEQEIFSLDELQKIFDLTRVQKKGGIFNIEKLNWVNREYVLKQAHNEQVQNLKLQIEKTKWGGHKKLNDSLFLDKLLKVMLDHVHRWGEIHEIFEAGEYNYLFEEPEYDPDLLVWKGADRELSKKKLQETLSTISGIIDVGQAWTRIFNLAEKEGKGEILWPLRVALSGRKKSPDPQTIMELLGLDETRDRIEKSILCLET